MKLVWCYRLMALVFPSYLFLYTVGVLNNGSVMCMYTQKWWDLYILRVPKCH